MNPFIAVSPPEQAARSPEALPHLPRNAHGLPGPLCCIDRVRATRAARRLIENETGATGLRASLLWWQVPARADLRVDLLHAVPPKARSCVRQVLDRQEQGQRCECAWSQSASAGPLVARRHKQIEPCCGL